MKYGVQLYSLRETAEREGAEKILQMVSEAGYDGVEFAGFYGRTPEEMKELLKKYKLVGISAHIRPEAVEENLPYIDALGIKYVFIPWAGAEEFESAEKYAKFLSETKKAKALLDARGVGFGYHNHAHEFENGKDYLKKITDDVAGLKAELDVFWATVAGLDAVGKMKETRGKARVCAYQGSGEGKRAGSGSARRGRRRGGYARRIRGGKAARHRMGGFRGGEIPLRRAGISQPQF